MWQILTDKNINSTCDKFLQTDKIRNTTSNKFSQTNKTKNIMQLTATTEQIKKYHRIEKLDTN